MSAVADAPEGNTQGTTNVVLRRGNRPVAVGLCPDEARWLAAVICEEYGLHPAPLDEADAA